MMQQAEKWLLLETIDQSWKQHMLNLDHLKEGIGLRSWGQKNPLIEYKREAFDMFQEMMASICQQVVFHVFRVKINQFDERVLQAKRERELEQISLKSAAEDAHQAPAAHAEARIGRNQDCPCGSGKKYKKCHGG
jgi:preprotein translocase subunit SecA